MRHTRPGRLGWWKKASRCYPQSRKGPNTKMDSPVIPAPLSLDSGNGSGQRSRSDTYNADVANVNTIQAGITQAQSPLAAAEAKQGQDAVAFNSSLDAVSAAAQAAKVPVPAATS